jgi:hypothetical protein
MSTPATESRNIRISVKQEGSKPCRTLSLAIKGNTTQAVISLLEKEKLEFNSSGYCTTPFAPRHPVLTLQL